LGYLKMVSGDYKGMTTAHWNIKSHTHVCYFQHDDGDLTSNKSDNLAQNTLESVAGLAWW